MTDTLVTPEGPAPTAVGGSPWLRRTGWVLVSAGAVLLLYVVYLLWFTGLETDRAQERFLDEWELEVGPVEAGALPGEGAAPTTDGPVDVAPVPAGSAMAAMWFERPETDTRPVHEETLFVVEGVDLGSLRSGPGHYPDTAAPGAVGNFAVAGHRTTNSAPFYDLDDVQPGDRIHVVDRAGAEWVYAVLEQRIVTPQDVWVIDPDPLGTGGAMLTLTTCHPRFSDAQRLVVFAELVA